MQRRKPNHEESWLLSYADLITNLLLFFVILVASSNVSAAKMQQVADAVSGKEAPKESLSKIKEEIDSKIKEKKLEKVIQTELNEQGLNIRFFSGALFRSGDTRIQPEVEDDLAAMLGILVPFSQKYHFAVEGHTDSRPVAKSSAFPSNWELSTSRAIVVRERLEKIGIDRNLIRVEGYADTKKLPDDVLEGLSDDEQDALHRRVNVRVY